ncbi:hypothetical protein CHISP_1673 [Chitinispirillum alkaliphilum]|nr:hypothetical protein CHISP_1673 [Chitinispirillum alkaliphilum]
MDYSETALISDKITIKNAFREIKAEDIVSSVLQGLLSAPRHISSMHFYDTAGSKLFEKITALPEYYLTSSEKKMLQKNGASISEKFLNRDVVELGSGDCSKISILFDGLSADELKSIRYIPLDISFEAVRQSALTLNSRYPDLIVSGIIADFTKQLSEIPKDKSRYFLLLGSTIGNFTPEQCCSFLTLLSQNMGPDDLFLIGIDLVKDETVIHKAYNDSQLVTAAFNRNILNVINSIAKTNFKPDLFNHYAFFNHIYSRVEMHLRASEDMCVCSPYLSQSLLLKKGDMIHTENSYKFTMPQICKIVESAGLAVNSCISDKNRYYSLVTVSKKRQV